MKYFTALALAALVALPLPAQAADEVGYMTDAERAELLSLLDDSRTKLFSLVEGLSEEQWAFKPAPERWSVAECFEHIWRSEQALLGAAQQALANPPAADWQEQTAGKTERLRQVLPNRQGRAPAPQEIRPQGGMTPAELIRRFDESRLEISAYVKAMDQPLKTHLLENPFFGPLTAYDWLLYVPLHTLRHSKQIEEVKAHAEFPG